jgi:hypothetical protein
MEPIGEVACGSHGASLPPSCGSLTKPELSLTGARQCQFSFHEQFAGATPGA